MKTTHFKPIAILGAVTLVTMTAACTTTGGGEPAPPAPTSSQSVEEQLADIPRYDLDAFFSEKNPAESGKSFGMIIIDLSTDPFAEQVELAEAYAAELGWDFRLADLKGEVGRAGTTLKTMLETDVDVILTTSMGPDLIGRDALAAAADAGVPVISQTSGVNASESDGAFASSIESDLLAQGTAVGEQLIKDLPEGAKVAMLFDQQAQSGRLLEEGFRAAVGDKVEIVAEKQYDYAKGVPGAVADANAMLQAHPDLAAFWCPYDGPCSGPSNAVLASGKDIGVYSKGGYPVLLDYIRKGVKAKTLAEPNTIKVLMAFDQAVKLTSGKPIDSDIVMEIGGMITPDNISQADVIADGSVSYGPDLAERFYQRWGVG